MNFIEASKQWVETVVVELNLCPFAKRELVNDRVRFCTSESDTPEQLLIDLQNELTLLESDPSIETTLLIHPYTLLEFSDYNQFLDICDALLIDMALDGIYQIASFHPDYQFADTDKADAENYTNRSPYPMLHLIREQSLARAVARYPDADNIPQRNIDLLNTLGGDKMRALLQACLEK